MSLLYLPYVPSLHEDMILRGRRIVVDQMDFLLACVPRGSRLHTLHNLQLHRAEHPE